MSRSSSKHFVQKVVTLILLHLLWLLSSMRRFQSSTMSSAKLSKNYEHLSRSVLVTCIIGLSALHSAFTPQDSIYGLIIDAGSTGSRIHTYSFRKAAHGKLDLLYEDFHPIKPGLSSYKDNPEKAAESLLPLLDRATTQVPKHLRPVTPVVLRATAGLRMVGEDVANEILKKVRKVLRESEFRFDDDDWATILSGNEEGIYSWITVNYLLDRDWKNTVGTLEMGGGSAQIAYVPRDESIKASSGNCSIPSEKVTFKGSNLSLYTTSHLDFGLQKGRSVALTKFESTNKLENNPCINSGERVKVAVPFDESGKELSLSGQGDYGECKKLVDELVMLPALGTNCNCDVCTYHESAQPRAIPEYVAIAFYLERTVAIGLTTPLTVKDIREKGEEICKMSVGQVKEKYPAVQNGAATDLCLDLAFITLQLERGHGIHESQGTKLMVLDKINNFELGWCLGAMQQTMEKLGFSG